MSGWTRHEGMAVGLPLENIDTDQLIPARFMSTPRSEGYGRFLLHDMRFESDGTPKPTPLRADSSILVTRRNFGSGSSREAAVYALIDYGIRVVVAPSFGDIFTSNAVNNGLLPVRVSNEMAERMLGLLEGGTAPAAVDIEECCLYLDGETTTFDLSDSWRFKLINGFDDIDITHQHSAHIEKFSKTYRDENSWAWPSREATKPE